jgi:hypothetical protein
VSEEILKSEKLKKPNSVSGTVNIFARGDFQPGKVTVAKTSTTGYEWCVGVGMPTEFVSDDSYLGYQWKATFEVWGDDFGSWPVGAVSPVIVLAVYNATGVSIGTVNVTLVAILDYVVVPPSITFAHPDFENG